MTDTRENLASEVKEMLDGAVVVMVGEKEQPASPKVPKPTVAYVVVNADWDPSRMPSEGWKPMTLAEAKAQKRAFEAGAPGWTKVILEVTTTYRLVGGGGRG